MQGKRKRSDGDDRKGSGKGKQLSGVPEECPRCKMSVAEKHYLWQHVQPQDFLFERQKLCNFCFALLSNAAMRQKHKLTYLNPLDVDRTRNALTFAIWAEKIGLPDVYQRFQEWQQL